jgi:phospholipase/lecithinase/hemolysin
MVTMVRNWRHAACGALATLGLTGVAAAAPVDFLFVAGDSLSDPGNVYAITRQFDDLPGVDPIPESPPYYQGRFSNGPVWTERLAERLDLDDDDVKNVALGGASTSGHTLTDAVPEPFRPPLEAAGIGGVKQQVDTYLAAGGRTSRDGLYVVWGGANDYLFEEIDTDGVPSPVANLRSAVADLADAGARRFLVPNLPDLGRIPSSLGSPSEAARLSAQTAAHNRALETVLAETARSRGVEIEILDVAAYFEAAIAGQLSFANVTEPCIDAPSTCPDSLFFDGLHPTAAAHEALGDIAHTQVVPLPAGVVLFATALLGTGLLRRFRQPAS